MKCAICDSEFYKDILVLENMPAETFGFSDETITLNVAKCTNCGAVQLVDVPLNENYREVYRSIASMPTYREKKKEELNEFIDKYELWDKDFFELGCGDGQFLDIFKELGIDADGYEAGPKNLYECGKKGYMVLDSLENTFDEKYDVIFSSYFLEHIPDPVEAMTNVIDKLNPGGLIYFECPNYSVIERDGLWLEFTRDHRFYYDNQSIKFLLYKVGFDIIKIEHDTLNLKVIARKPDKFSAIRKSMDEDINNFNKLTSELGEYALVGAGHWTQLLLKQASYKPKYIFDTVPAKIGNRLCGVMIQSQDEIVNCNCENIIISCGAYNEEAKKNIEKLVKDKNIMVWG